MIFFAAVPPPEIRERMAEAWRSSGSGEYFRRDTVHMTLLALGKTNAPDRRMLDRAGIAASALSVGHFELCFDRLMTFGGSLGNRALVLGTNGQNQPADDLAATLYRSLLEAGFILPKRRKLVPHVTLAYGAGFAEPRHLAEPIRWTIRDITLIDSIQGQGRHDPLGRWPL